MSHELSTFLTAMTPIGELRVALPIALIHYKMSVVPAYVLSVAGNILPVFFLLLFWQYGARFLRQIKIFDNFFAWLFERTRKKFAGKYEKWGKLALLLFVAVPLPVTGAWTGSLAAWLFGFKYWESIALILAGVCLAGVVVAILSLAGMMVV